MNAVKKHAPAFFAHGAGLLKSAAAWVLRRPLLQRFFRAQRDFALVFRRFREVLDSNNRALEIITDIGEKLGGEYLFDRVYVRSAYADLFTHIANSIQSFDVLTGNRYPTLHDVFTRIDGRIRSMIEETPSPADLVLPFEDITPERSRDVGGKNVHLAEMKSVLKLAVPDGFAVSAAAYDIFIKYNGLEEAIARLVKDGEIVESERSALEYRIVTGEVPPELDAAIGAAVVRMRDRHRECSLAVRSSAEEEDGDYSFAGQFETVLNVACTKDDVVTAYKKVVASLFSPKALAYQQRMGYTPGALAMAVGCVLMVDAVASGVAYTSDPEGGDRLLINANWGLGVSVVEGRTDADLYTVTKDPEPAVVDIRRGAKELMVQTAPAGGVREVKTAVDLRERVCLTDEQIRELSRQAVVIERYYRKPQDIEWALGRDNRIYVLQARPLRMVTGEEAISSPQAIPDDGKYPVLLENRGVIVQKGVGVGRVFILRRLEDLETIPKGAVLVAKHDSPHFVRVMPSLSAIITDTGAPTSHMASLSREFRVPTIVNAENATEVLKQGQEVTVSVEDEGKVRVFGGRIKGLVDSVRQNFSRLEDLYEYRKKRYVLRYISLLNLVDPLLDDFSLEKCRTMHDILRFMHEKAVSELVESTRSSGAFKNRKTVKLDLPIPTGILVIDIGGGLDMHDGNDTARFEQVSSVPLRAVLTGMMHQGVWHSEAIALKAGDFLTSMMRMSDIVSDGESFVGYNIAVASKDYMNMSLRFGYHFNMLDCYCSENRRNNHIYFRFVGGATDITKRSRRIRFIAEVLKEYGFNLRSKGDLIIARLAQIGREEMIEILDQIGRLIAYTRQLDAVLHDDGAVERYVKNFLSGSYDLSM